MPLLVFDDEFVVLIVNLAILGVNGAAERGQQDGRQQPMN